MVIDDPIQLSVQDPFNYNHNHHDLVHHNGDVHHR